MIRKAPYYMVNNKWVVPKFRPFAHADKPILVIDGTLQKNLLELQIGRKFKLVEIAARRNLFLIHVVGNDAGSVATMASFTNASSEPVRRFLCSLKRDTCLFTYKKVRNALGRDGDPACGHFSGDIRGSNAFKNFQRAVIYGRLQIPEAVAVGRAAVLASANGLPAPCGKMEWVEHAVETRHQKIRKVKYLAHTDPLVQSIVEAEREDEIEQAIDRLRLVWHKGDPKAVIVVNNLPLAIKPDAVICWEDVRDGRAAPEAVHATLTGLIPASGEQGPAARPDIWNAKSTASRHMNAQLKPNWKDFFRRLLILPESTGKRKQAIEVFYRPSNCIYTAAYQYLMRALGF